MKRLSLFVLFFLVLSAHGQDYEVSITSIQVWIKAFDRNDVPVKGLTASDFTVFEDNEKVNVTCFEEIEQEPGPTAQSAEQTHKQTSRVTQKGEELSVSKIVLFVDLLNTSQAEYLQLRERSEEFFKSVKGRQIPMMLVALTPTARLGVLERFTTETDRIRIRFGKLQANSQRDTRVSNARREISRILRMNPHLSPAVKAAENVANVALRKEEQEAEEMLNALDGFQNYWSQNFSEHAVVIYASGGVNAEPGRQYYEMIANFRADMATTGGLEIPNYSQDARTRLKKIARRLNRGNLTFYTLNTRGPINVVDNIHESDSRLIANTNYLHDYQEFQDVLANETGGLSFRNTLNFEGVFKNIISDISHYYLICYSPPAHKEKNQYHQIKVRVNRPDIRLRHRAGYQD